MSFIAAVQIKKEGLPEFFIDPINVRTNEFSVLKPLIQPMDKKYAGMTVNERIYASGLVDECGKAVCDKNIAEVVRLLKEVELTDENIRPILESWGLLP